MWRLLPLILLTGCSAYDLGLEPLHLGAGEYGRPMYSEDVSRVKSPLSGAPN